MKLLYLHGFRSSPQSAKAQKCFAHVEALRKKGDHIEWYCPQLPPSPKEAMEMVMAHIDHWQGHNMGVMGSSLGGFYATYVSQHKRCGAVLFNPAVKPSRFLRDYIEQHPDLSEDEQVYAQPAYIGQLEALEVPLTMPERYFVITAKDDETLNYKEALSFYKGSEHLVLDDGGHELANFDGLVEDVFEFLGLGS